MFIWPTAPSVSLGTATRARPKQAFFCLLLLFRACEEAECRNRAAACGPPSLALYRLLPSSHIAGANQARHLISYQFPYKVEEYGFDVDMILKLPLTLTGETARVSPSFRVLHSALRGNRGL